MIQITMQSRLDGCRYKILVLVFNLWEICQSFVHRSMCRKESIVRMSAREMELNVASLEHPNIPWLLIPGVMIYKIKVLHLHSGLLK